MTRAADLAKLIAGGGSITVSDNSENLKLITTDADASVGPTLRMDRQSASAADSDLLGKINFVGHNDAGTPEDIGYAGITAIISDASDGTEDGKLAINTMVAGTERSRIFVDAGETVFNEDSIDVDFRVESNGLTNAFMVDGGNNGIGFNHTPRSDLHTSSTQTFFGTEGSLLSQRDSGLGIPGMTMTQNVYIDSDTGAYAYMTTNEATKIDLKDGITAFSRAASGTAGNAITFSESMRIDTSGKVGIGTTSPYAILQTTQDTTNAIGLAIANSSDDGSADSVGISFALARSGGLLFGIEGIRMQKEQAFTGTASTIDSSLIFQTIKDENTTEKMRINAEGVVMINTTTTSFGNEGVRIYPTGSSDGTLAQFMNDDGGIAVSIGRGGSDGMCLQFTRGSTEVGGINVTSSGSSLQTSSDYRLKENVDTEWDATTRLKQLKPSRFSWIIDKKSEPTHDGFLAHEVMDVVPEAIVGTKDEVHIEDNDIMGIKKDDPVYQTIDQSKLVPLLTKALQEAVAKIETLEAKVATLESK